MKSYGLAVYASKGMSATGNTSRPCFARPKGITQGLKEALNGQTLPLSQMWEGIDVEQ
ncbi:MAG: hypothetical protein WA885_19065 [Phormidesmis sp.]